MTAAKQSPEQKLENNKISLKEYLESRVAAEREFIVACHNRDIERIEAALEAMDKASLLLSQVFDSRMASHNEFREQINQERGEYVRKDDLERLEEKLAMQFKSLQDRVEISTSQLTKDLNTVANKVGNLEGRLAASVGVTGALLAIFGVVIAVVEIITK